MLADISSIPLLTPSDEVRLARRIEAGLFAEHLLVAGCPGYATTGELWAVRADGKAAWLDFYHANLRMAAHIANRWALRFRLESDDIMQECCVALGGAIMAWDWARGTKFSTLAWPRMTYAAESACWQRYSGGQSPTWWMRNKSLARRAWNPPRRLTEGDEAASGGHIDDETLVKGHLAMLDDRGRAIIERRFGLHDVTPSSYRELAADLDVSQTTIKRWELNALAVMAEDDMLMAA